MSDDKLPRIPSFAELGISEDEIEELEREIAEEVASRREADAERAGEGGVARGSPAGGASPAAGGPPAGGTSPASRAPRSDRAKRGKRTLFGGRQRKKAVRAGGPTGPASPAAADSAPEASLAPPPWRGTRGAVSLAMLLVVAWFSSSFRTSPAPVPATAPATEFSSARAMPHLERIAAEAHPPRFTRARRGAGILAGAASRPRTRAHCADHHLVHRGRLFDDGRDGPQRGGQDPRFGARRESRTGHRALRQPRDRPGRGRRRFRGGRHPGGAQGPGRARPAPQRPDRPHHRRRGAGASGCRSVRRRAPLDGRRCPGGVDRNAGRRRPVDDVRDGCGQRLGWSRRCGRPTPIRPRTRWRTRYTSACPTTPTSRPSGRLASRV